MEAPSDAQMSLLRREKRHNARFVRSPTAPTPSPYGVGAATQTYVVPSTDKRQRAFFLQPPPDLAQGDGPKRGVAAGANRLQAPRGRTE